MQVKIEIYEDDVLERTITIVTSKAFSNTDGEKYLLNTVKMDLEGKTVIVTNFANTYNNSQVSIGANNLQVMY